MWALRLSPAFSGLVLEAAYSLCPSASLLLELWGLTYGSPWAWGAPGAVRCPERSRVYPADGEAIPQPWSWPLGGFHCWPDSGVRAVPGRWLWVLGAFPLAGGVSGARFDCEKNGWAGQCCCILLLPCSPCLLSFVWVPSCSDLSPSTALAAALWGERSTWALN